MSISSSHWRVRSPNLPTHLATRFCCDSQGSQGQRWQRGTRWPLTPWRLPWWRWLSQETLTGFKRGSDLENRGGRCKVIWEIRDTVFRNMLAKTVHYTSNEWTIFAIFFGKTLEIHPWFVFHCHVSLPECNQWLTWQGFVMNVPWKNITITGGINRHVEAILGWCFKFLFLSEDRFEVISSWPAKYLSDMRSFAA